MRYIPTIIEPEGWTDFETWRGNRANGGTQV
jgi:hypothetical protein